MSITDIPVKKAYLDTLFNQFQNVNDSETQSHLAKYLTILVSGYLQSSILIIFRDYTKKNTNIILSNYIDSKIKYFRNPSLEEIYTFISEFDKDWCKDVKLCISDETKTAITNINIQRNKIAHGVDSDISYYRIKEYYNEAWKILDVIQEKCK